MNFLFTVALGYNFSFHGKFQGTIFKIAHTNAQICGLLENPEALLFQYLKYRLRFRWKRIPMHLGDFFWRKSNNK